MNLSENQIFDALGVAPMPGPGADESSQADAVPEESRDPQDPESSSDDVSGGAGNGAEQTPDAGDGQDGGKPVQSKEERARHAAERRRQEVQAAIDAALREERDREKARMDDFFRRANLKNTLTEQPITSMSEFDQWHEAFQRSKLERDLKSGKLSPEALQRVIEQTPAMQKVRDLAEQADASRQQADQAAFQARVDQELAEIRKSEPSVQSVADLLRLPNADAIRDQVRRGKSFLEAYRLVNFEALLAKAADQAAQAARQQALNNARSKDHLSATSPRGGGAASVPSAELELFRALNPGASEGDIQKYYNNYVNKL